MHYLPLGWCSILYWIGTCRIAPLKLETGVRPTSAINTSADILKTRPTAWQRKQTQKRRIYNGSSRRASHRCPIHSFKSISRDEMPSLRRKKSTEAVCEILFRNNIHGKLNKILIHPVKIVTFDKCCRPWCVCTPYDGLHHVTIAESTF